jgi:hypothetical protein
MTTFIKLFLPYCSCNDPKGISQQSYEYTISELFSEKYDDDIKKLNIAQNDAILKYGWRKMCCRNTVINSPTYFILNSNAGAITTEVISLGKDPSNMTHTDKKIYKDGPSIVPRRTPPDFPILPGITMARSPPKQELIFKVEEAPKNNASTMVAPFTLTNISVPNKTNKLVYKKNIVVPT